MLRSRNPLSRYSHVIALTGYVLLTILMTYPLGLRLSSHLAGSGDDMWLFQWNNWWLRKVLSEGLDPYFTAYLFHPHGVSLVYHNFSWLNTGIWLALEPFVGSVAAYNVTFLLTFIIGGYATYALISYLTKSRTAAFVAGLVFAFSPYHLSQFNHPNLISVQWLPLCMLFLIRTVRKGRWRDVLLCILFLVLTALSRWQLLIFAAILMALYLGYSLLFERGRWTRRTVLLVAIIGLGTATCISPLAYPLVAGLTNAGTVDEIFTQQQDWAQTDLLAYIVPNQFHPLFGQWVAPIYDHFRKNRGNVAFLGYSVLLLSGYGALRARREGRYWLLAAVCLMMLALGPVLRLNGRLYPGIPMPYRLVGWIPLVKALRNSDRFNVVLSLPLAVLAGYGIAHLLASLKRRFSARRSDLAIVATGVALAGLVLFEYLSIPLPTTVPLDSPFYHELAHEAGEFAILEVPMGRGYSKAYMFLQTLHGKRLVEGHVSRTPSGAYDYIINHPFLESLSAQGDLDRSRCDLSRQLGSLAADNIRYIVIHKADVPQDRLAAWRDYLTINPRYEDDGLLVYRTAPTLGRDYETVSTLGGGLALVRAAVTPTSTTQGGTLWVDLRWTSIYTPAGDYAARLALVNSAGEIAQEETAPLCNGWPTSRWGSPALVTNLRSMQMDPHLPPSVYQLTLAVVETQSGQVLTPTWAIATMDVSALERRFEAPPMQHPLAVTFGQALALLGYDLGQDPHTIRLTLYWQAKHRLEYYKVFIHLYDAQSGALVLQNDTVPRQWTYPTNWWEEGEVVSDEISLDLSQVPPGRYRLAIGAYEPDTGVRLMLSSGQDHLTLEEAIVIP